MGSEQSKADKSRTRTTVKDVLKFLEEEVKNWNDVICNLRESLQKGDSEWVPAYLGHQINETENRWKNIKASHLKPSMQVRQEPVENIHSMTKVQDTCGKIPNMDDYKQMESNIQTLLVKKQKADTEIQRLERQVESYEKALQKYTKDGDATSVPQSSASKEHTENDEKALNENASLDTGAAINIPKGDLIKNDEHVVMEKKITALSIEKANLEKSLRDMKKEKEELLLRLRKEEIKHGSTVDIKSQKGLQQADADKNLPHAEFVKRMINVEDEFLKEKKLLQTENEKLMTEKNNLKKRVEQLEKNPSDLLARSGLESPDRLETESAKQQKTETLQQRTQVSGKKDFETKEEIDETSRKLSDKLEEEKSKNKELVKENDRLREDLKTLEKEMSEILSRNKSASEHTSEGEREHQKQRNEETLKKQSKQDNTTHEKQTGRDNPINTLRKKCQQMENEKMEQLEQREMLKAQNDSLQTYANQLKREKDELLLRLSKFAGDKLVDNNPAITDLSDPNRPTKLGEFYSEIYDNEWTNAFEALVRGGYDEVKAIETLRLTLQNVMQFCERKSELLLQKVSDAVNLLFEEYRQTVLEMRMPSHLTMPKQQARDVGQFLRREKSSLQDIKLQRRWEPDSDTNADSVKTSSEKVLKEEHSKLNADTKLKQLRKDMASSMVPIVQKAYIEASWTNRCIEELKPYILKCLYLGWMMVVQSPPQVLHEFPTEKEIKFDKNMYKEYTASGPLVSYVVWPALLLKENGPVVCKGVAEGKKP